MGGPSVGYDPYDYYDLGEYDQKGATATWYGTRDELNALIKTIHDNGLQAYADLVINHNSGGDAVETNPIDHQDRWTIFNPKSGRFNRDWTYFHPSYYETWDGMTFGDMPDLCHRNPDVYSAMIEYARWLIEEVGFDGFRYDCVKGYGAWMVRAIQELRGLRGETPYKPFGVGECWDSERTIDSWLDEVNSWSDNPACAFDFPLRDRLKGLCDSYGFDLRGLSAGGVLAVDRPLEAMTFVDNHDTVRSDPIVQDKMLAYAYILTHEGYPCVFWQDYYTFGLANEGDRSGIAALVQAHEQYAAGPTVVRYADADLYIAERSGGDKKGLVVVLNNRGEWHGTEVTTQWPGTRFEPVAWRGSNDTGVPLDKWSWSDGSVELWAPPRGYAVYVPQ